MDERVRCARCWKRVPATARFCRRCGYTLKPVMAPPPPAKSTCGSRPPCLLLILAGGWLAFTFLRFTFHSARYAPLPAMGPSRQIAVPEYRYPVLPDPQPQWLDPRAYPPAPIERPPQRPHARRHDHPQPDRWYWPVDPPPAPPADPQD